MPRKPARSHSLSTVPDAAGGAFALRERLLTFAGFDEKKLAILLKESIDLLHSKLTARKTSRLSVAQGRTVPNIVETFDDIDHGTQLAAADLLLSTIGAYPSKNAGHSGVVVPVQVNVSFAKRGDLVPAKVEVVQAK